MVVTERVSAVLNPKQEQFSIISFALSAQFH